MRLIGLLAALLMFLAPAARASNVGFEELHIASGGGAPLTVGVWYPTDAAASPQPFNLLTQTVARGAPPAGERLPLIVFSHGTGGWYGEHVDTALALAQASFVVAAVTHTGDNYKDHSQAGLIWQRSAHIRRLIDYMLTEWPEHGRLDPGRVGMFGFSAGGFTTLVIAGGLPDLARVAPHCQAHPGYFDCGVVKRAGSQALLAMVAKLPPSVFVHDPRVRAAVVAAPALGFTFGSEGLKGVTVPVQLWRAESDHILPTPEYADAVHADLPTPPEFHLIKNADHYDFLAPCTATIAKAVSDPEICASRPGFDRARFHEHFDADVVRFFRRTLTAAR
jgi:predicted dienelactone hydrolase